MNYKEQDKKMIISYLQGKDNVDVEDLIEKSGAESYRIYPILFEFEMDKTIEVVETGFMKSPKIIRLRKS